MNLSVVIATYNGAETLAEQLHALARQRSQHRLEVVVSDNGSTDATVAIAESHSRQLPRMLVVDSSDVRGVSHARNVGATRASGDCLLFCDQDDIVGESWLDAMATALGQHPFVAARLDHLRLNPPWTLRFYGEVQRNELPGSHSFLPWAWGCTIGIRRDLHFAVGGFDETFHEGGEDNDYCWRVQLLGTPLRLAPAAVVHYRHRQLPSEVFRQSRGYGRESARLLKRYRAHGMQRTSQLAALSDWALILPRLPLAIVSRERQAAWVARLGWRLGRLDGSLRARVLAL